MRLPAVVLALVSCSASTAAAAPARYFVDDEEVLKLRARSPHAAELLEQGEALAVSGAVQEADDLFRRSEREDPDCSLSFRRDCEALTVLGKREQAVLACSRALSMAHTNPNVRAVVRSLVDGPTPPTTAQVLQALSFTAVEEYRAPGTLTPMAAACDIAGRIGEANMLEHCADALKRMAPDDPDTRRAISLLESQCPPWRFWLGWSSILAVVVGTFVHAVVARRRAVAAAAALLVALCCCGRTAWAATSDAPASGWLSKWSVDEDNPARSIPSEKDRNADPLEFGYWLQDVALRAERADAQGDHAAAVKYYLVLAQVVPDRAVSFIKLCEQYAAMGETAKAIDSCGDALLRDGTTVKDYVRFVQLVLSKPGLLSEKEVGALGAVIEHMRADPAGQSVVDELECEVGTRTSNVAQLRECTAGLAVSAPNDARTLSYEWDLAVEEHNFGEADKLLERARVAGFPPESLDRMSKATASHAKWRGIQVGLAIAAMVLLFAAVAVAGRMMSRWRRAALSRESGPATPGVEALPHADAKG